MLALLLGNPSLHIQSTADESLSWFLSPPGLQKSTVWGWWPSNCCSKQEAPTLKRTGFQVCLFVYLCSLFLQLEPVPPWGARIHKTQEADSRLMIPVSSSQFPSNNLISSWFVFMVLGDLYSLLPEIKVTMQISNWYEDCFPNVLFPKLPISLQTITGELMPRPCSTLKVPGPKETGFFGTLLPHYQWKQLFLPLSNFRRQSIHSKKS